MVSGDAESLIAEGTMMMISETKNSGWVRRFRFPVLLVAMFAVMAAAGAVNSALSGLGIVALVVGIGTAVGGLYCYRWLSRSVEGRQHVGELEPAGARSGLLRGMALGGGMFFATMLIILIFGGWDHVSGGSFWGFLGSAGLMAGAAVNEELLFRGVVFRVVAQRFGTWPALALSAVIFGVVHLINANATLWGAISVAVEAGVLFGAAYAVTRSLWLPIGLHFAWNLAESGVFGTTVSGAANPVGGLLHTTLSGPTVLTGGSFGPEASLVALVVCLVPAAIMLRRAARQGGIVRRRTSPRPAAVLVPA